MSSNDIPGFLRPPAGFQARKAAQIAALFALRSDGVIEKLKLIKLIYISERKCLAAHHAPMLYDDLYSLKNGPICSGALNGIDGKSHDPVWSEFIARHGNRVVSTKRFCRDDFDEISDAEIDITDEVWSEFGRMTASQIRNWSHDNCPEYEEVTRGRRPISYERLLRELGDEAAEDTARQIEEFRQVEGMFSA